MSGTPDRFDPYALLGILERQRVGYVLIGSFARIIHGTDELTDGVDIVPSLKSDNLRRLERALDELDARLATGEQPALAELAAREPLELSTNAGELKLVREPAGTRGGYDDVRRAATREPIGKGLRPLVASIGDLARMLAARGREDDQLVLQQLRTLADLERTLGRGVER